MPLKINKEVDVINPVQVPHGFFNWQPIAATSGTDVFFANNSLFVASIWVPFTKVLTGIGFLLGSVGGSNAVIAILYNHNGQFRANTTVAASGTTAGTAANTQEIAFTATYVAKGPRLYYIGIAANGGTAKLRTIPAFCNGGLWGASQSWTHGTVANITPPVAFTPDQAPVCYVY